VQSSRLQSYPVELVDSMLPQVARNPCVTSDAVGLTAILSRAPSALVVVFLLAAIVVAFGPHGPTASTRALESISTALASLSSRSEVRCF
jgi:hypothetical protein